MQLFERQFNFSVLDLLLVDGLHILQKLHGLQCVYNVEVALYQLFQMLGLDVGRVVRMRIALLDALEIVLVLFLRLVIRPELLWIWQRRCELIH